jgi:REP element-mobilizing transposase RayT
VIEAALAGTHRPTPREIDAALDRGIGPRPLASSWRAELVCRALRHFHDARYVLHAWCVMPNHVHVVATWLQGWRLGDTVRGWKAFTAAMINRAEGLRGSIWAKDYFDRFVRSEDDFAHVVSYVEHNPVRAGLVDVPEEWPYSSARMRA